MRGFYETLVRARLAPENRALLSPHHYFLRSKSDGQPDQRLFAMAKWTDDGNVIFVFHNLWNQHVSQEFFIPQETAERMLIRDNLRYKLYDLISRQQMGACRTGAELKWTLPVIMNQAIRAQWLRLEQC